MHYSRNIHPCKGLSTANLGQVSSLICGHKCLHTQSVHTAQFSWGEQRIFFISYKTCVMDVQVLEQEKLRSYGRSVPVKTGGTSCQCSMYLLFNCLSSKSYNDALHILLSIYEACQQTSLLNLLRMYIQNYTYIPDVHAWNSSSSSIVPLLPNSLIKFAASALQMVPN